MHDRGAGLRCQCRLERLDALRGHLDRLLFRPQRRCNASELLLNPQRFLFQVPLPAPRSPRTRRRGSSALYRRHHPRRNAGPGQQTECEHADADGCADGPDGQQFGPPQASRTGSLCTEATIAAPVPTASASNTTISAVIFTMPPKIVSRARTSSSDAFMRNRRFPTFWGLSGVAHLGFAQRVARRQPRSSAPPARLRPTLHPDARRPSISDGGAGFPDTSPVQTPSPTSPPSGCWPPHLRLRHYNAFCAPEFVASCESLRGS
jgi:hypothetical protein